MRRGPARSRRAPTTRSATPRTSAASSIVRWQRWRTSPRRAPSPHRWSRPLPPSWSRRAWQARAGGWGPVGTAADVAPHRRCDVNPIRVVLGLGFGDEGKGTIVDWLASQAATPPLVVRWNGGPQAAHHVVTDDGRVHCFAQLGAGSFVAGARTHLCGDMAVDLYALWTEAEAFAQLAGGTAADSVG